MTRAGVIQSSERRQILRKQLTLHLRRDLEFLGKPALGFGSLR